MKGGAGEGRPVTMWHKALVILAIAVVLGLMLHVALKPADPVVPSVPPVPR